MTRNASENGSDDVNENKTNSLKRKQNVLNSSPSDFDMFALVYNFLQSNGYKDAAEKMTKEMKRRLKTPKSFSEKEEEKEENNTKLKKKKKKKLMMVQMLNALGTKKWKSRRRQRSSPAESENRCAKSWESFYP